VILLSSGSTSDVSLWPVTNETVSAMYLSRCGDSVSVTKVLLQVTNFGSLRGIARNLFEVGKESLDTNRRHEVNFETSSIVARGRWNYGRSIQFRMLPKPW